MFNFILQSAENLFLEYARNIVEQIDDATKAIHKELAQTSNTITIASIPAMAQYGITDILEKFKRNNPRCQLNILQAGTDKLKDLLLDGACELAFVRETEILPDEFIRIPYTQDTMAAVLPAKHTLAQRKQISLEQLKNEEFILLQQNTMLYLLCKEACEMQGFQPNIVYTDHKVENIIDMVENEMGVSLLMKKLAIFQKNPNIAVLDIVPTISTTINLCYRKSAKLSNAAKQFIQYIQ